MFTCDNCNQSFTRKASLDYHIKKNACREKNFNCKYCQAPFSSKRSMYRHIQISCKVRKEEERVKSEIYLRLVKLEEENKKLNEKFLDNEKENNKLKKKVASMEKFVNVSTTDPTQDNNPDTPTVPSLVRSTKSRKNNVKNNMTNINNGNINNNISNNINNSINNNTIVAQMNLVGYGLEDMSKIDKNEMVKILQKGFKSAIGLTETLHFNPKYPEYHNIYISNIKDKYAMMYDGKNWELTMKEDLINKIYDDKKNYIEDNIEEFLDSLSPSRRKALERWLETDESDNKISKIKEEIKLLLYNKRDFIIDSQNNFITHNNPVNPTRKRKSKLVSNVLTNPITSITPVPTIVNTQTDTESMNELLSQNNNSNNKIIDEQKDVDENLDDDLDSSGTKIISIPSGIKTIKISSKPKNKSKSDKNNNNANVGKVGKLVKTKGNSKSNSKSKKLK